MESNLKRGIKRSLPSVAIASAIFLTSASSCNSSSKNDNNDTETVPETFHADNDIAMTVKSLVDAIKVGEDIDSLDYDYIGILTDGEGAPLYTNLAGYPGEWAVDVLDEKNVSIKNLELGDLLPGDLESYLISCLGLGQQNKVYLTTADAIESEDLDVTIYDFEGGYIRFENRLVTAPNGLQGSFFTIMLSCSLPKSVETQTAV